MILNDANGVLFISQFIVQEKQFYIIINVAKNFFKTNYKIKLLQFINDIKFSHCKWTIL